MRLPFIALFSIINASKHLSAQGPLKARSAPSGYVCAPGDGHLYLDDQLFDFRVFNTPTIFQTESQYEVKDLLRTIKGFGTPVTRSYTLQVANDMFKDGLMSASKAQIIGWDNEANDWKYNETVWRNLDIALDLTRSYGVKVIFPIINQDYGKSDSDYVGNFNDLIRHRYNISNYGEANKAVDWFTDRTMIEGYKKLLDFLLNRVNTVNGIRYGQDDTILAFETGNEMNWGDAARVSFKRPPPAAWTLEIAQHIKSLAPNTLVMDGSYSRNAKNGTTWEKAVLDSEYVDLFTYHLYGDGDVDLFPALHREVRSHGKTLIIGEHGFYSNVSVFLKAYQLFDCAGALAWSLRGHSEKGGFVTHGEGNNIYSYHAPGWKNQTSKDFDIKEAGVIAATYDASFAVLGLPPARKPTPGAPEIFFITNETHAGLTWRGAAWADRYEIYGSHFQGVSLALVANQVQDNVGPGELFIPLDPSQPTKTLLLPPRETVPFVSQAGWEDPKWCVAGADCYTTAQISSTDSTTQLTDQVILTQKSIHGSKKPSLSNNAKLIKSEKPKYRVLSKMFPPSSQRKRSVQGGWYSVRSIAVDGTPGKTADALYLKTDWFNWSYSEKKKK